MKRSDLAAQFEKPPHTLGGAPFWFLNERLDKDELIWQVRQMREANLSGYVMHARYGLKVPYLSEEWFDKIGAIVEESEKLGMNAIIYDEVDWPSGMSGTRVLDDHPEYCMTYLDISWLRCENLKGIDLQLEEGQVVAVIGAQYDAPIEMQRDFHYKVKNLADLSDRVQDGRLVVNDTTGIDIVFCFVEKELVAYQPHTAFPQPKSEDRPFHQPHEWNWYFPYGRYVDLLNPDAVDYFIETTHEEYRKRFAKYFGTTIQMAFTDEPGFYTIMRDKYSAVQWSPIFAREFEKEYGYSIVDHLPALVSDIGERTVKVRHDFWAKLSQMFEVNFVKKLADWCEANNLQLTGHFRLCNPFLIWQMQHQGNVIGQLREMHVPGIDLLDNVDGDLNLRWGIDENVWQIPNKIVSSVAHQHGQERIMSESFALGGWKYTLQNMKILSDWQYFMGINFMVPHAFHYSISAQRKRECPPSLFYQNPVWDNYKHFSDYQNRMGAMTIGAAHVADIAVLFPMDSLWAEYPTGTAESFPWDLNDDFSLITDKLLRWNLDYDILGQDELEACEIQDGQLKIRDETHHLLLVPPMTTVRRKTADIILDYVNGGGSVLFLGLLPHKDNDGHELTEFLGLMETELNVRAADLLERYQGPEDHAPQAIFAGGEYKGRIALLSSGPLYQLERVDAIQDMIEKMISRDVHIDFCDSSRGNVYCSHWVKDGLQIFLIVNSDERSYKVDITLRADGVPSLWNPETGEIAPIHCFRRSGNGHTIVPRIVEPLESFFVVLDPDGVSGDRIVDTDLTVLSIENGTEARVAHAVSNTYTHEGFIDYGTETSVRHVPVATGKDKVLEFSDNWIFERGKPNVVVLNRWVTTQGFAEGTGWFNMLGGTVIQEASFHVDGFSGKLRAIFDKVPEPNEIYLNGTHLQRFTPSDYLDHQMKEVDITRLVKPGKNVLRIVFELKERAFQGKTGIDPIELMFDPVMIVGDFAVTTNGNEIQSIVREESGLCTGTWTEQGYPFFVGSIEYRQQIYVEEEFCKGRYCYLELDDVREAIDVTVNGVHLGVRLWEPYRIDLGDSLRVGVNDVRIRVWNTLANLLDLRNMDSGIIGGVRLVSKSIQQIVL